jgi:hypothetical protein
VNDSLQNIETGEIYECLTEILLKIQVLFDVKQCRLDVLSFYEIAGFLGHFTELLNKTTVLLIWFLHNTTLELSLLEDTVGRSRP